MAATKTKKKYSAAADERKARGRFVDQPGQWIDRTPKSVKKRRDAEFKKLERMMKSGKKK